MNAGGTAWPSHTLDETQRQPREQALLAHARALVGVRLADIAEGLGLPVPAGRVSTKGWAGQIVERELLAGARLEDDSGPPRADAPESAAGPDFAALGIELKTVPVDAQLRPRESTAVCMIDPIAIAGESWDGSTVRAKLDRVLWVALRVPEGDGPGSVGDREVAAFTLWSMSRAEEDVLRADFDLFVREFFRRGRAGDITGHLGVALQVRPKANNARDQRTAYDPDGRRVRIGKCGFYLRPTFVGAILARSAAPPP